MSLEDGCALQDCTGGFDCTSAEHWHGCYADIDGTNCDEPEEHSITALGEA